jgi:hypothetical protein
MMTGFVIIGMNAFWSGEFLWVYAIFGQKPRKKTQKKSVWGTAEAKQAD